MSRQAVKNEDPQPCGRWRIRGTIWSHLLIKIASEEEAQLPQNQDASISFPRMKKKTPSIISSILRGACVWVRCSLAATPVLLFISGFLHSADLPAPRQDFIPCHCAREHGRLILFEKRHSQFASQGKPPTRAASSWPPNKSAAPDGPAGTSKTPCAKHGPWANQHFVPTFFPLAQDVITKPPRADKCEIREEGKHQTPGGELWNRYNRGCLSGSRDVSTPTSLDPKPRWP